MASIVINSVQYNDVPEIDVPKVGSGTAKFYDTSAADGAAGDVLSGKVVFSTAGSITGNMANNGATGGTISTKSGTVTIPAGYTSGGTVSLSNVSDCLAQNILSGKSILGTNGSLTLPTISQNSSTKVLTIQ